MNAVLYTQYIILYRYNINKKHKQSVAVYLGDRAGFSKGYERANETRKRLIYVVLRDMVSKTCYRA